MSEDDIIRVGDPLPRISAVEAIGDRVVRVRWVEGGEDLADLDPVVGKLKFFKALRNDPMLFARVRPIADGNAIAWGPSDEIDMDASTVRRLASETMRPAVFAAFLARNRLTLEAAAAELGISRRQVAHYSSERLPPRYIRLACAELDRRFAARRAWPRPSFKIPGRRYSASRIVPI